MIYMSNTFDIYSCYKYGWSPRKLIWAIKHMCLIFNLCNFPCCFAEIFIKIKGHCNYLEETELRKSQFRL